MPMRKTCMTLTAPILLAAACFAGTESDGASTAESQIDVDQGCLGEIMPMSFTQTSARVSGRVECVNGGKLKFALCIRRRLIPSVGSQMWGLVWSPVAAAQKTIGDEIVGKEDCQETPEQEYDNPPPGTSFSLEFSADVFCGELGARYLYTPTLKSVRDFNSWNNLFLGDDFHTLARGSSATRICGATW
jgi:hypothetical protein